jgi:hypothetical protein
MFKPSVKEVKSGKEVRILCVPDTHFPFDNEKKVKEVVKLSKEVKPTHIVQVGDLYDMYSFSRFTRSLNLSTPAEEILEGRNKAEKFWGELRKSSPLAFCYQLRGNHCERLIKKILSSAPEFESLIKAPIKSLTQFEGVYDMSSSKDELCINNVRFVHGWSTNLGFHVNYFMQSCVHGHSHRGGVAYVRHKDETLFELDCGYLADGNSLPLDYRETLTSKWTPGVGLVDKLGPRFICL